MKWGACNQNKLLLVDYVAVNQMLYLAKFDLLLPSTFPLTPPPRPPTFSLDFCRTSFLYKPDVIQLTLTLKMSKRQSVSTTGVLRRTLTRIIILHLLDMKWPLDPVVRRPISANLWLNFNPGFLFFRTRAFSRKIFFFELPIIKL